MDFIDHTYQTKLEKLSILEQKKILREHLPHLYGFKWYPWAREFYESRNRHNFLVAANQISKSSTQIRKCIDWATDTKKWPKLWRTRPLQFWYMYPSKDVATIEFEKKWVMQFLPSGPMKDDPVYGWKAKYEDQKIFAIHFHSGVSIYFKTYGQSQTELQTGTVDAIFADEELPEELYSELNMRLVATAGYFHMVFTATLGQEIWRETMEERGTKNEKFPAAFKLQVSMFDCLKYEDGSDTPWTPERIKEIIASCKSQAEVDRRVWGKFVLEGGLKYSGFDRKANVKPGPPIPKEWHRYVGVDVGGGGSSHPAAICFVAVNPEFTRGRVFRAWRGDSETTTAGDVYDKCVELQGNMILTGRFYDHQSKDFATISNRQGAGFIPAEKSHNIGEGIMNTLYKTGMLTIDDDEFDEKNNFELKKLALELTSLKKDTPKNKAKDDLCDANRYAVTKIPWNFEAAGVRVALPKHIETQRELELRERREAVMGTGDADEMQLSVQEELDSWNELYDV